MFRSAPHNPVLNISKSILLGIFLAGRLAAAEFRDIVRTPELYHNKPISVTGLALVEGDRFYLFESTASAADADPHRAIFVRQKEKGSSNDRYNNHWITV